MNNKPTSHFSIQRRALLLAAMSGLAYPLASTAQAPAQKPNAKALKLIEAARSQIGVTTIYDGSYVSLSYPDGDVPIERGVCTDVIIRAYRKAFGYDLQKAVHEDMKSAFSAYPKIWGMKKTDRNIEHRRVPNLQTFFKRKNALIAKNSGTYQPGDLVTHMLPGNLPHIVILSDKMDASGKHPLVIHNIGGGAREEDRLHEFTITGHYRFFPV